MDLVDHVCISQQLNLQISNSVKSITSRVAIYFLPIISFHLASFDAKSTSSILS